METLGSTSAICSDKTGTLTLNQMTARELVVVGRRYAIEGEGYATEGRILRVAGESETSLDPFLLPMALANDAPCVTARSSDPTEALVVLAAKGGLDVGETRRRFPRVGEVPFDSDYKFMATFHEMDDDGRKVVRCFVKERRTCCSRARPRSGTPRGRRCPSKAPATVCSRRTTASPVKGSGCWRWPRGTSTPRASTWPASCSRRCRI